ncbi:MAG: hypothetical protein LUI87_20100 [Lachnospiraceae bacterium]|nr:hypothetical protein [Lachnospiraceae bacterium]
MNKDILIAVIGNTDPIRGQYDGPLLHIVRWYRPEKVFMILTEEIARTELEYHQNEEAIHMLDQSCEVELINTGVCDAHSFDDFSLSFLSFCSRIKEEHPENRILLNISSGTPQMQTALCMIALSDPARYCPVQVSTPEHSANRAQVFNPRMDLIEEWFENDMDNLEETPSRCMTPKLLNFRRTIIQMQIISLIENYDYSGACQIYETEKESFSDAAGILLKHAKKRVNLENKEAEALALKLGLKSELYPFGRTGGMGKLIDFFNSMKIKQFRGELNDFSMRLEIMAEYLGIYVLENVMKVRLSDITTESKVKGSKIIRTNREKCTNKISGIEKYLNEQFADRGGYEWGKPLNALTIIHLITYLSKTERFKKYSEPVSEMMKWVELSSAVRNPAAHTIVSITDDMIRESYGKDSAGLCRSMQRVLIQIFGTEVKKEAFDIYDTINDRIKIEMENS